MHAHFATQHACATFAETSQLLGDATKNGCNLDAGYARPCTGKYAVGVIKSAVCMSPAPKKNVSLFRAWPRARANARSFEVMRVS